MKGDLESDQELARREMEINIFKVIKYDVIQTKN